MLALVRHFVVLAIHSPFSKSSFSTLSDRTSSILVKGEPDMKRKSITKAVQLLICLVLLLSVYSAYGAEADKFPPGTQLPQFTVGTPDSPEVQRYLGLKNSDPFKLSDIGAKMVLIEFSNST
jgi:hypothetical protein